MFEFFKNLFKKKTPKEINATQIVNQYLDMQEKAEKELKENFRDTFRTLTEQEKLTYKEIYGNIFDDLYKNSKFDFRNVSILLPDYGELDYATLPMTSTGSIWSGQYNVTLNPIGLNPINLGPLLGNQTSPKQMFCYDCGFTIEPLSERYMELSIPDLITGTRDICFCNDCFEEKGGDAIKKSVPVSFSVSPAGFLECPCCATRTDSAVNERYFMGIIEPLKSNNSKFYVFCKKCYTDYINVW